MRVTVFHPTQPLIFSFFSIIILAPLCTYPT